ncbi:hypothetical protein Glove_227g110 [Diversispora epigaea]|uniref:Uncharacterized protein n=1 Tax=Diversispora epigaea TaxID=1348612 RepID=A0A397ILU4_9GLOM|nr:hypothetical protein Glove_227g110 [Diversispora epigaea]
MNCKNTISLPPSKKQKKKALQELIHILKYFKEQDLLKNEFAGTAIHKINEGLEFKFPMNTMNNGLHSYEIYVLNKVVQDIYLPFSTKAIKRTFDDIVNIVHYIFYVEICQEQRTIDCTLVVRENAICENCFKLKKTLQQIQQRILTGVNSTKTIYASKEIQLINKK